MMSLVLAAAAAVQPSRLDEVTYTVRAGDTLITLEQRYLAAGHDWRDLGRLWHVSDPQRLPCGRAYRIPRAWLRWTAERAHVVSLRGRVVLQVGARVLPSAAGAVLSEGALISTNANSFTTLALSNGSRIALPSLSRVRITHLRKYAIDNAIDYRFTLDDGRIDTKDTPLKNPGSGFIIETPVAMTAVRGTEFAVAFDPFRKSTGTTVFEGAVAVSAPARANAQIVPAGFGAITNPRGTSMQIKLLPAPALTDPARMQTEEQVTFDLTPQEGAIGYHVQLARDAGFVETFAEQVSTATHFAFADVPNGNQFVRVSAIGEGDLRGLRQSYAFKRHLASIAAEARQTSEGLVFRWDGEGEGIRRYRLQISSDEPDAPPIVDDVALTHTEVTIRNLPPGTYVWRVGLTQTDAEGTVQNWTQPEKLTVTAQTGG